MITFYPVPTSGVLCTLILYNFITYLTRAKMDIFVFGKCKVGFFVMHFCVNYSSALLVISVEKFIALYFPLKTKTICTGPVAKRVSIVTSLIFVLSNAQFFYIIEPLTSPYGSYIQMCLTNTGEYYSK